MNKKILTLLIAGGLLMGTSGIGMAYAASDSANEITTQNKFQQGDYQYEDCDDEMNQRQTKNSCTERNQFQNKSETTEKRQQHGKDAISKYAELSGMTDEEILEYMKDNECSLTELATEKGNLEDFTETFQEEE
ncbi:MAG: hypothetical protein JJE03_01945 [Peptostreptococcaceae bacterium]|nr:hypothetical protein [Peptostreptococcaceae bacterium]